MSDERRAAEPDPPPVIGMESFDVMLSGMRASLRAWEVMNAAWLGFWSEQMRRWTQLSGEFGEAPSGDAMWRRQSEYMSDMMRAYSDACAEASAAAGDAMRASLERRVKPAPASEAKRAA
jgi:hypothetical protein